MIDATGTSFHGTTIRATVRQMMAALGPVTSEGTDDGKVTHEWIRKTDSGDVFTVYDWKEYRVPGMDDRVEWHIGAHSKAVSERAKVEIVQASEACFGKCSRLVPGR